MTSVGLYNRTPSTNLADSAFPCASVGFKKTDTRGGKFWLSAPALFRAAESFSSTGNDGTAFRRSYDSAVPIHMMAEDDERSCAYGSLVRSASTHLPGCVRSPAPPFRAISARFPVPLVPEWSFVGVICYRKCAKVCFSREDVLPLHTDLRRSAMYGLDSGFSASRYRQERW